MLDTKLLKSVVEQRELLRPMIARVVKERSNVWPIYGGGMLDRSQYVTSSEIGGCARKVKFDKLASPVEGMDGANGFKTVGSGGFAERGNAIEAWVVSALREFGLADATFMMIGDQQKSFVDGDQSGTPDGVIITADGHYILEIKSIDPRFNKRNLPKPEHIYQCVQNWDIVQANMPDAHVLGVFLVYVDASNFEDIKEFYIDCTTEAVHEIADMLQNRAATILAAESAHDLPPEGIYNKGCTYCSFQVECNSAQHKQNLERKVHDRLSKASKFFG